MKLLKLFKAIFNYGLKLMGILFLLGIIGAVLIPAFISYDVRQKANEYNYRQYDYVDSEEDEIIVTEEEIVSYDSIVETTCEYPHNEHCPDHQPTEQEEIPVIRKKKVDEIKSGKKMDKLKKRIEYLEKVKEEKRRMEEQIYQEEMDIMEQEAEILEEKWELIEERIDEVY